MTNHCGSCGDCGGCGGCGSRGALELTAGEVEFLELLGQVAFLPVARRADDMIPVCLEDPAADPAQTSLILQCLEARGLILIDYEKPLGRCDMTPYRAYPVHGTVSLTLRGQTVLDLLQIQGFSE